MQISGESTLKELASIFIKELRDVAVEEAIKNISGPERLPNNSFHVEVFNIDDRICGVKILIRLKLNDKIIEITDDTIGSQKYSVSKSIFITEKSLNELFKRIKEELLLGLMEKTD